MIVKKKVETFITIEMTESQAHLIHSFLDSMQARHYAEIIKMSKPTVPVREAMADAMKDLLCAFIDSTKL